MPNQSEVGVGSGATKDNPVVKKELSESEGGDIDSLMTDLRRELDGVADIEDTKEKGGKFFRGIADVAGLILAIKQYREAIRDSDLREKDKKDRLILLYNRMRELKELALLNVGSKDRVDVENNRAALNKSSRDFTLRLASAIESLSKKSAPTPAQVKIID